MDGTWEVSPRLRTQQRVQKGAIFEWKDGLNKNDYWLLMSLPCEFTAICYVRCFDYLSTGKWRFRKASCL